MRNRKLLWGGVLAGLLALTTAAAPWLAQNDPDEQLDPAAASYRPPGTTLAAVRLADGTWRLADRVERLPDGVRIERLGRTEVLPASRVLNLTPDGVADHRYYLLGSDKFGRDLWARMLWGGQISLAVGLLAAVLSLIVGVAIGSAAALGGHRLDTLLMRFVDAFLSLPGIPLLVTLSALFRPKTAALVLILALSSWTTISRLVRAELLSVKEREFILAARSIGLGPFTIFRRHLLPNAFTPVLIQTTLLVGQVILAESSLSFIGMGVQPPTATWGNLLAEGRESISLAWWIATFPGIAISIAVIAFNLLGDGLRDVMDPRTR
jgi:peptide/nickel transport system permease protein